MTNQDDERILERIRSARLADLSDGMDAIGLINKGTMSPNMRPLCKGTSMAGFAYTVKLIPVENHLDACTSFEEYQQQLGRWCEDVYSFVGGFADGKGKDMVIVIDAGGCPAGVWGSEIAMNAMKNGVVGVVIDGACRDCYETKLEKAKVWCTVRTCNHIYGRLTNGGVNIPIRCAGVDVRPGDIVCGDDDGVLVIPRERAEEVLRYALKIREMDQKTRAAHYKDLGYPPDETLRPGGQVGNSAED